jgi:hypothetical protein
MQMHIKKLNVVGCILYIAAHPDDENTRLLSYVEIEDIFHDIIADPACAILFVHLLAHNKFSSFLPKL